MLNQKILQDLEQYIEHNLVDDSPWRSVAFSLDLSGRSSHKKLPSSLREALDRLLEYSRRNDTFQQRLLRLIDDTGRTDAEIYRRAHTDRRLFAKIRANKDYKPSKRTVLALALALKLDMDKTEDLLNRAGFYLSCSQKEDVIVEYFIKTQQYDIDIINDALMYYELPPLTER